jgi:hypothetical protein
MLAFACLEGLQTELQSLSLKRKPGVRCLEHKLATITSEMCSFPELKRFSWIGIQWSKDMKVFFQILQPAQLSLVELNLRGFGAFRAGTDPATELPSRNTLPRVHHGKAPSRREESLTKTSASGRPNKKQLVSARIFVLRIQQGLSAEHTMRSACRTASCISPLVCDRFGGEQGGTRCSPAPGPLT